MSLHLVVKIHRLHFFSHLSKLNVERVPFFSNMDMSFWKWTLHFTPLWSPARRGLACSLRLPGLATVGCSCGVATWRKTVAAHRSRRSKVGPVLLVKGERTRARVSGAEISFKRLTPGGRLESVRCSGMPSPGMMYRLRLREEPQCNTHTHTCTHLGRQALVQRAPEHVCVGTHLSSDKTLNETCAWKVGHCSGK